ncbi:MAG TPA: pitrilysin family protein [Cyclobacteriaceae bacterium]|nr:insulinase family protein [Cyclobacteriaceae bacterium]HMV09893.1 pitrilysin family protein [Cyclobacteriaceae bacterium]HMV88719.1 pitrilysin family protein [Cyclobacteriaceae bacterium]HMW99631.1 pitrilysin family protein [Cyclobacteriaceae bacterium]HMX50992.1 pitrilysin family protein [Cyclobacteriaceae bacterium]
MKNEFLFTLPNGIRVVYQHVPNTKIVHCGIFLDVGSRDENPANQGIAHFWEHMAFKGTERRKSFHIISSLDAVGGELNAYTDKEKIVFYASVRDQYTERAIDILADITFHSVFPQAQIDKERGVILEEMAMYLDTPDDSLQDEFDSLMFENHPMGMNILGRRETVSSFMRKDFVSFFKNHVDTSRVVFSCVGNIPVDKIEKFANKYLHVRKSTRKVVRERAVKYIPREKEITRPVKQGRCAMGREAYPIYHENRIPFYMLVNMLGGPGMNSRLNIALREKYGFVYSVDAHYVSYTDTGMFVIYFGTEIKQLDKCISLVKKELLKLMDAKLSVRQLAGAKEQIKGQLAMSEENNLNQMMMMGRSILNRGYVPSLDEIFGLIDQTNAKKIQQMAREMFDPAQLSYLKMIPGKK